MLEHLDPDAPLDDLTPLDDIVGDARVVALGEGSHFLEEFWTIRRRIVRFLHEQLGFDVLAMEFGLHEASLVRPWLQDRNHNSRLGEVEPGAAAWGTEPFFDWLRELGNLDFVGIDIPSAGGSWAPAYEAIHDFVARSDPTVADGARALAKRAQSLSGTSAAGSAGAWAALSLADQDALTAGLARIALRLRAVEEHAVAGTSREEYDDVLLRLRSLVVADYMMRANHELQQGHGVDLDFSVRDRFMADAVLWHLDRRPDARVVLLAHNGHVMRNRVIWAGGAAPESDPMGRFLTRELGEGYRIIGTCSTANFATEMVPADNALGFATALLDLPVAGPGTVEHALTNAGLTDAPTITDLRPARNLASAPTRIRSQSGHLEGRVVDGFDALVNLPTVSKQRGLAF